MDLQSGLCLRLALKRSRAEGGTRSPSRCPGWRVCGSCRTTTSGWRSTGSWGRPSGSSVRAVRLRRRGTQTVGGIGFCCEDFDKPPPTLFDIRLCPSWEETPSDPPALYPKTGSDGRAFAKSPSLRGTQFSLRFDGDRPPGPNLTASGVETVDCEPRGCRPNH